MKLPLVYSIIGMGLPGCQDAFGLTAALCFLYQLTYLQSHQTKKQKKNSNISQIFIFFKHELGLYRSCMVEVFQPVSSVSPSVFLWELPLLPKHSVLGSIKIMAYFFPYCLNGFLNTPKNIKRFQSSPPCLFFFSPFTASS